MNPFECGKWDEARENERIYTQKSGEREREKSSVQWGGNETKRNETKCHR